LSIEILLAFLVYATYAIKKTLQMKGADFCDSVMCSSLCCCCSLEVRDLWLFPKHLSGVPVRDDVIGRGSLSLVLFLNEYIQRL
jgi:hypothetical protein